MKMYTRTDLMELPAGVIYTTTNSDDSDYFQGLFVMDGATVHPDGNRYDWAERDLLSNFHWIGYTSTDAMRDLAAGKGVPLTDASGREGLFDDEMRYVVFEIGDLEYLQKVIAAALKVSHEVV